jgi:hypothetical protein
MGGAGLGTGWMVSECRSGGDERRTESQSDETFHAFSLFFQVSFSGITKAGRRRKPSADMPAGDAVPQPPQRRS